MTNVTVFRPRANLIWGTGAIALDALYLVQVVFYPTKNDQTLFGLVLDLVIGILLGVVAYGLWLRPKLVLGDDALTVINPIGTTTIAYRNIRELEPKWALLIHHSGGATRVWVAPTNGRIRWSTDNALRWNFGKLNAARSDQAVGAGTAASDSLGSDSGIAAELIRQKLKRFH